MKRKYFGKSVSLVLSAALTVTMGSFPVAAETTEEGYEAAFSDAQDPEENVSLSDGFAKETETESEEKQEAATEEPQETDIFSDDGAEFDGEGFISEDATSVEEFDSEGNLPEVQANELAEVYLDPANGDDSNSGESTQAAVKTYARARSLIKENGRIYLLSTLNLTKGQLSSQYWFENVEILPIDNQLDVLIHVEPGVEAVFNNVKISGLYLDDKEKNKTYPILVEGTLFIQGNSVIGPFPGQGNIHVKGGILRIVSGEIVGTGNLTYKTNDSCGVYATNEAIVVMSGGVIRDHVCNFGSGMQVWNNSNVTLVGGEIKNNIGGLGGGIYVNGSTLTMTYIEGDKGCSITGNQAMYDFESGMTGVGGGLYLDNSTATIWGGSVSNNKAQSDGGISLYGSQLKLAGIGEVKGNTASFGAGIGCYGRQDIAKESKLEIEGGVLAGNYDLTTDGEKDEEDAIVLSPYGKTYTLYLSGAPVISGVISLPNYLEHNPMIYIQDSFTPEKPLLLDPGRISAGDIAVTYAPALTVNENYKELFTTRADFPWELKQDGQDLKWSERVRVEFNYTTSPDLTRGETKSLWISKNTVLDSSEIPEAADIPGYTRIGWMYGGTSVPPELEEDQPLWNPDSVFTLYTSLSDVWTLDKPEVSIVQDKEESCPAVPIVLTANVSHEIQDDLSFSYQWYKEKENDDDTEAAQSLDDENLEKIEDATEATYEATEEGTYVVEVTASADTGKKSTQICSVTLPDFEHEYDYEYDSKNHWQVCEIGKETTEKEPHQFGEWEVTKEAAIGKTGEKERECEECGYVETATIPALPKPTPTAAPTPAPTSTPAPTVQTQGVKTGTALNASRSKNSITLKWSKTKGADGYMIYGAKCGSSYKLLKTVKGSTTKWTHKKLQKGTYYKYYVVGYKLVDKKKVTVSKTVRIHVATTGRDLGYAKKLQLNKSKVTLKPGKTATVKAKILYSDGCVDNHVAIIRHYSSNRKVATVNSKGVIKAKKKGSCTIYYYAQNGLCKTVKVKVK